VVLKKVFPKTMEHKKGNAQEQLSEAFWMAGWRT
jgi:hypothetical protein